MTTSKAAPPLSETFRALFGSAPYFGGATFGFQGDYRRHMFMGCAAQLAIRKDRPMHILEIGSWVGSSALTWAQALRQFSPMGGSITCIDLWEPFTVADDLAKGGIYAEFNALAKTEIPFELFLHNTRGITGAVTREVKRGKSREILPTLKKDFYDLVYVDASHYYDDVLADLKLAAPLVRDGGLFCGDDLEMQVGDADEGFIRARIKEDWVHDPKTGTGFHPGVALACHEFFGRRIPSVIGFFYLQRAGSGYVDKPLIGTNWFVPEHFTPEMQATCRALMGA